MSEPGNYGHEYTEESFQRKLRTFARRAGASVVVTALTLYHVLRDPDTPAPARSIIIGALGYFIAPLDAIPDFTPAVGFADDLGALAAVAAVMAVHTKPEHRERARRQARALGLDPGDAAGPGSGSD